MSEIPPADRNNAALTSWSKICTRLLSLLHIT